MKKRIIALLKISICTIIIIFLNSICVNSAGWSYQPDIAGARIRSSPVDEGIASDCFDGDINTYARTAKVNPAWVQIEYPERVEISNAKVSLGKPGYYDTVYDWWLECADSQVDMDNKTNSYRLVISKKSTTIDSIWDEMELSTPVTRKIWRFTLKAIGEDSVQIPELQLWSDYQGINLDLMSFIKSKDIKVQVDNVINNNVNAAFDGNPTTFFAGKSNPTNVVVDMGDLSVMINRIRFFVGKDKGSHETDRLVLEAADSINDLNSKSGTYKLVYAKGMDLDFESHANIILSIPVKKRFWRFHVSRVDSKQPPNISQIELWADKRYCDYPPSSPAHLNITERKENYCVLEWSSIKDATGNVIYQVFRDNKLIGTTSACKFKDIGLNPQKSYLYNIKAYNILRKLSERSPSAEAMSVAVQTEVISVTIAPTEIGGIITTPIQTTDDVVAVTDRSQAFSTMETKPTAIVQKGNNDKESESEVSQSGITLKTKIILSIFVVIIAFLGWFIMATIKMKKKIHINQKKREAELDTIKQLLMEEKTDHVIDLLEKKDNGRK
ncbi:fibronectin type III domain-containing protein [Pseudobacteroides cellulosolvens]|uniref:Coagulation factor 5/8 type domain protein n=1 Tax=Pseudobacteroides cellulosolvens ATCC 35603 = DSM 2933 TaxID=398512 RepID=A0A0L6JRB8_9FIRM|nr:fibronectin type III domain-containing protein [Pseudobacteroides cellulosolvens]KNY28215.1 hypothetical protein Bccel_3489 [Pseudobacteroides cellulosolvens ATCC 35603 = DSM 2933]